MSLPFQDDPSASAVVFRVANFRCHGAEIGAIRSGWLFATLHPKWALCSFYVLSVVTLVAMGCSIAPGPLILIVAAVGAFTLGTQIFTNAYGGMYRPSAIRSTSVGLNYSAGRVGGILAPVFIGWLVGLNLAPQQNFVAIAVAGAIGAVAIAMINHNVSAAAHQTASEGKAASLAAGH